MWLYSQRHGTVIPKVTAEVVVAPKVRPRWSELSFGEDDDEKRLSIEDASIEAKTVLAAAISRALTRTSFSDGEQKLSFEDASLEAHDTKAPLTYIYTLLCYLQWAVTSGAK